MSEITIIDYSFFYFNQVARTTVQPIRGGKFVQLINNGSEYLIFSPKELSTYHANIVERFCLQNNIDGFFNKSAFIFDIFDPAWGVTGGGKWKIDECSKSLHLFDKSQAYGKYNDSGLEKKLLSSGAFSEYSLRIE